MWVWSHAGIIVRGSILLSAGKKKYLYKVSRHALKRYAALIVLSLGNLRNQEKKKKNK